MTNAHQRLVGLFGATLVGLSALAGCGGEWDEAQDLDLETGSVVNGTSDLSGYPNERARTVPVNGLLVCSGVVLRPNVILTARHCVTSDQTIGGPVFEAYHLSVGGVQAKEIYAPATNVDAAVALMKSDIASPPLDFTVIDPYAATRYVDFMVLQFMGYGKDNAGNVGTLRMGEGKITAANQNYSVIGGSGKGAYLTDTVGGSATAVGDSGGPLWGYSQYPRGVAGVVSAGPGTPNARSIFAQAADFRHAVRTWLTQKIDSSISLPFDNASDINNFTAVQGASGTAPSWSVTGGNLVQSTNAPQAMMIKKGIFENVFVSTGLSATESTALGVIVRYVDKENFVRCEANVQNHTLKLIRRRANAEQELGSVAWNGTFSGVMSVTASENKFTCTMAGTTLGPITNSMFAAGRVGLWNHYNKGAKFTHLGVAQQAPVAGTW
jgi:V8-like Glu-specific endopeptidase